MTLDKNRCVVTGLGMISAIGNNVNECWNNALNSVSGIKNTTSVDTKDCYATLAAEVESDLSDVKVSEDMDRVSKLCIKASREALADAGLGDFNNDPRVSVIIGSCVGGVVSIEHYFKNDRDETDVRKMPISAIASSVAGDCHAGGVVTNVANACAAGTISIAYACDLIRAGKADVVVAGGADAFASVPYSGFLALHALDSNPCSPFNHCTGITLGEGSGCVIVESYEHAKKRNAKIYCEILGSGVSSDAHHITAPRPDGEGQMNAIRWAIESSGIEAKEIGYINAHGTGTAKNDNAEFLSLHTIFDSETDNLSVSSTKAMVGHCLGAAGAIEAVFAIKALTDNVVPATLGYSDEDLEALKEKAGKIDFVPNEAHKKELNTVMSNSFAFGGNNASIVFSKNEGNVVLPENKERACITGFGIVSPLGNGVSNYINVVNEDKVIDTTSVHSTISSEDYNELGLKMAFYRKLDNFSQLEAVSGMAALKNSNYEISDSNATKIGIVVGTSEGALGMGCVFEESIAEKGNAFGSAFKFPNTVYNAAGGYLSICSGVKGYNVTITNGAQSGLHAVAYAKNLIEAGKEEAILASGCDENIEIIDELYHKLGYVANTVNKPYSNGYGFSLADGSTTIMVEKETSANNRNAKKYCYVSGYGLCHHNVEFATLEGSGDALVSAIKEALADSNLTINDIDAISGFANGSKTVDSLELAAYKEVFGDKLKNIPIFSVKERMGEGRANSAALACAHAALLLSGDIKEDKRSYLVDGESISNTTVYAKDVKNILVTAYGSGGSYSAVVLTKE